MGIFYTPVRHDHDIETTIHRYVCEKSRIRSKLLIEIDAWEQSTSFILPSFDYNITDEQANQKWNGNLMHNYNIIASSPNWQWIFEFGNIQNVDMIWESLWKDCAKFFKSLKEKYTKICVHNWLDDNFNKSNVMSLYDLGSRLPAPPCPLG